MIPPVLTKSDLVTQPVLRVIWNLALVTLKEARRVTFVGYSLPVTDIAAMTLFSESLGHLSPADVKVVDHACGEDVEKATQRVLDSYKKLFPEITKDQIDLRGGLAWGMDVCKVG